MKIPINLIIFLILILLGIGLLYYLKIIEPTSSILSFFLYILSIPTAILIKKFKKNKTSNGNININYKKNKEIRIKKIKEMEENIIKNKKEIEAINAAELEIDLEDKDLTELAAIGRKLLTK